ncbi:polysaccharide deacetylase family protein [Aquimarina sediminis]|uniref:polysaccharide deacetylase family protein n=1 Tax=Aquimarina sediminis TaxID=2070536 RepID=UPI000C9FFC7D|nr:polysaccharide deacetylase family protein [Aquimarina sediminis]
MNKIATSLSIIFLIVSQSLFCQKKVAITIDDVPNTIQYEKDGYNSLLLKKLDSLSVPITIFVNEGLLYKTASPDKNFKLLTEWYKKEYITLGNHSFNHSRYSVVGIDSFKTEIIKGAYISKELANHYKKPLRYFRFPYNDMGKDSIQHHAVREFLTNTGYTITPFTIESSDWMYNSVYLHYLEKGDIEKAREIGRQYVNKTIAYFDFFEKASHDLYRRPIHHIYLCHDNRINADYLDVLLHALKKKNYEFITLDEALSDKVYDQEDRYYHKWGVSWMYRYLDDKRVRSKLMKSEPSTQQLEALYNNINQ